MTEREYIQHIRRIAEEYRQHIAGVNDRPRSRYTASADRRWESVKLLLSPYTAIAMCDAWLEKHGKGAE